MGDSLSDRVIARIEEENEARYQSMVGNVLPQARQAGKSTPYVHPGWQQDHESPRIQHIGLATHVVQALPKYRLHGFNYEQNVVIVHTHDRSRSAREEDYIDHNDSEPPALALRFFTIGDDANALRLDAWRLSNLNRLLNDREPLILGDDAEIHFGTRAELTAIVHRRLAALAKEWEAWSRAALRQAGYEPLSLNRTDKQLREDVIAPWQTDQTTHKLLADYEARQCLDVSDI